MSFFKKKPTKTSKDLSDPSSEALLPDDATLNAMFTKMLVRAASAALRSFYLSLYHRTTWGLKNQSELL